MRGLLLAVFLRAPIKLKLFRGTVFLNDTNCVDEPDGVTVKPLDRISVTVGTVHDYFTANSVSDRKIGEVLHGDNLARAIQR